MLSLARQKHTLMSISLHILTYIYQNMGRIYTNKTRRDLKLSTSFARRQFLSEIT